MKDKRVVSVILVRLSLRKKDEVEVLFCPDAKILIRHYTIL